MLSTTRPYPILARAAFTATPVTASLKAPSSVDPGTDIEFSWEGPNNPKDFITVVKKGTPVMKYGTYAYVRKGSPQKIRVGEEAGDWELRYLTGVEYRTLASHPFTIGAMAAAAITSPANVKTGADFTFTWTGPSNRGDFITLVPKGTPEKKYERYVYARRGSPASLRAPDQAGEYELRYLTGQKYSTLGMSPITVGAVSATVKGPASVEGGQAFQVSWTGPGNASDWIAVSPKGGANREYKTYSHTRRGNPVKPGFPFWILASSILRSFSLERKPFLTAGTHRAGPKCFHWTLSFSEGDNSSVGRQFFRHSSELHSAASRFRTRERPFYPLGSGSAQILCSMSPNSLRFRCPSANSSQ